MLKYILKRVLQFIPVFLGVTLILFAMENIVPGDPIKLMAGEKKLDPQTEINLRASFHLIQTDADGNPIYDENGDTIKLAVVAIVLEAVVGIGAGLVSAIKRYSFWDVFVTLTTSILVAMPAFWLGMLLQLFFGVYLKDWTGGAFYLPISADFSPSAVFDEGMYYILPAITLASVSTAYAARIMRSQLLEVMNQDYIRTARAKGLSGRQVIWRHALKNAMIPVVTYIGNDFGGMMAGAILTETVFNWPGVGFETYRAINQRDWPIVLGSVTVIVILVMVINLLVDISYAFLDPRIRYGAPKDEA